MSSPDPLAQQRRRFTEITAMTLLLAAVGGYGVRVLVAEVTGLQWLAGCLMIAGFGGCCIALRLGWNSAAIAGLLLTTSYLALAAFGYAAGGIDAPVMILVPFIPIMATILIGPLAGWAGLLASGGLILLFAVLQTFGHVFPPDALVGTPRDVMRTVFYLLCSLLVCVIGSYYARTNEQLQADLRAQACKDFLTGLANRRALEQALAREARRARRHNTCLSVLMADLDHFKTYNDNNGHLAGDRALEAVADVLRQNLRRPGDMIGRYGGEEFCVVLPETSPEHARQLAEGIRRHVIGLQLPYEPSLPDVLTVTLGVASCQGSDIEDLHGLIEQADRALYAGKHAGRNRVAMAAAPDTDTASDAA